MRLANTEGGLELLVAGRPLGPGGGGDGFHCLSVDGAVRHPRGGWRFRGRFCRIDELAALAGWFEAVAGGRTPAVASVGGFMCHALAFAVFGSDLLPHHGHEPVFRPAGPGVLRVTFGDSTSPPWCDRAAWVWMDFPLADVDLRAMAAELREQLRAHPPASAVPSEDGVVR